MKKVIALVALMLAVLILFASCNPANNSQSTTPEETSPETTTPEVTTPSTETPDFSVPDEPVFRPKKILAIGNSFSVDAMEHLGEILVGEGYTDFVLGNLYIGGCSLDNHKSHILSGAADYRFYVNTGSGWTWTENNSIQHGLAYLHLILLRFLQRPQARRYLPDLEPLPCRE